MGNKFGVLVVSRFEEYEEFAEKYKISISEVLQIDLNRSGIFLKDENIRENFRTRFKAKILNRQESWYALPVMNRVDTNFSIVGEEIFCFDKKIGVITSAPVLDTCENSYQRGPHLLNLNSRSRSNCGGCKACIHNYHNFYDGTVIKDKTQIVSAEDMYRFFKCKKIDVANLEQIAVVTGLFGSEEKVVEHMCLLSEVARSMGFCGQLMYFGCEVNSENALKKLASLGNFQLIYALDNFTKREVILSKRKSNITLQMAKKTLDCAKKTWYKNYNFIYLRIG